MPGFLTRTTQLVTVPYRFLKALVLTPVDSRNTGWWNIVREAWPGAWQQNVEITVDNVLAYFAIYACVTLIASDISKMRIKLVQEDEDGIWTETERSAFSPVLRTPNHYQQRIMFLQWWITSKLLHGNTYVLKIRDNRRVVEALYILDPRRVRVLVAPNGDVYYEVKRDDLSLQTQENIFFPASEIIHDVMNPLHHPLVGVSPIHACGLAALQGLKIQNNSYRLFANAGRPGGVIMVPGPISQAAADSIKAQWDTNFTGENLGKVAILGDSMKFEAMTLSAEALQLVEQLKFTAEIVCACFHVPPYMIGLKDPPASGNVEAMNQQYYSQALQNLIEAFEEKMDYGLGLAPEKIDGIRLGTELDLDDLLRMDTATKTKAVSDGIGAGFMAPNEGRRKFDLKPVPGGDSPYMQQQNYSLDALNRRDQAGPPPPSPQLTPVPTPAAPAAGAESAAEFERTLVQLHEKAIAAGLYAA